MTPDGIYFVDTELELKQVEEFRFQRFIRDMKFHFPTTDYSTSRLRLPGDCDAKHIYIQEQQQVVVSSRLCAFGHQDWASRQIEIFAPHSLDIPIEQVALMDIVVLQRGELTTHQDWLVRLIRFALQYVGQRELSVLLMACRETELPFYQSLGFQTYKENHHSLEMGFFVPVQLVLADLVRLYQIASPLFGAYALPRRTPHAPQLLDTPPISPKVCF